MASARCRTSWREPRRKPPRATPSATTPRPQHQHQPITPPLVIFCATSIKQESRLLSLERCLNSLAAQTVPVRVYVAWHASSVRLRRATLQLLDAFSNASPLPPMLIESASPLSQFQHLDAARRALAAESWVTAATWVLFTDDDDISAPDRVERYAAVIARKDLPSHVPCVLCTRVAMRCVNAKKKRAQAESDLHARLIASASDVDAALRDGDAEIREMHEWWCYAVKLDAIEQFLDRQPPGLLAHRLADLRFRQWLAASVPVPRLEQALGDGLRWVYFYDRDTIAHDHAHRGTLSDVDAERAHRLGRGLGSGVLDASHVGLMRDVGEMVTAIGFDGPKIGVQLPRAQRAREIHSLVLEALQTPTNHWARMDGPSRERYAALADELGEELLQVAEGFVAR